MNTQTQQARPDFLYDLYVDCLTPAEVVVIAQKGVSDPVERLVLCEQLLVMAGEDACLLTDDEVKIIQKVACARVADSPSAEDTAQWQKLNRYCHDELRERMDEYVCPNCGGDMREGEHDIRVGVATYVCYGDIDSLSDYAYEAHGDR